MGRVYLPSGRPGNRFPPGQEGQNPGDNRVEVDDFLGPTEADGGLPRVAEDHPAFFEEPLRPHRWLGDDLDGSQGEGPKVVVRHRLGLGRADHHGDRMLLHDLLKEGQAIDPGRIVDDQHLDEVRDVRVRHGVSDRGTGEPGLAGPDGGTPKRTKRT
jgi:hypothetical protein